MVLKTAENLAQRNYAKESGWFRVSGLSFT